MKVFGSLEAIGVIYRANKEVSKIGAGSGGQFRRRLRKLELTDQLGRLILINRILQELNAAALASWRRSASSRTYFAILIFKTC